MDDKIEDQQTRWVARLLPTLHSSIDALLHMPLGLDVWERHADALVVAASEAQLSELERRRLAQVGRLSTVAAFAARASGRSSSSEQGAQQALILKVTSTSASSCLNCSNCHWD
jgi:hypothetical protein